MTGGRAILGMGIRGDLGPWLRVIRMSGMIGIVRDALVGQDQADDVPAYAGRAAAASSLVEAAGR